MPPSQGRDRLLADAVDHALSNGIGDQSLREIAAAIGTSHRMLIYHFGSRDGLLVAVVREVERREREVNSAGQASLSDARKNWKRLSAPALRDQERLFFEIYSQALRERPGTEGFLDEAVGAWLESLTETAVEAGLDKTTARALSRLGLAVTRGLLLDLLATGDRAGTTRALELFLSLLEPMSLPA